MTDPTYDYLMGLPDPPLCSRAQVLAAYGGKSVSWLYAEMRARRVPRPIRIGLNSVAWITAQIRQDIAAKIAAGPVELAPQQRATPSEPVAA